MARDESDLMEFLVDSVDLGSIDDLDEIYSDEQEDGYESDDDSEASIAAEDEPYDPIGAALQPGVPLFLIQRSAQHSVWLPNVASDIQARHAGKLNLGVVAPMPRMTPKSLQGFFEKMAHVPLRFADPEAFARDDSWGPHLAVQKEKPYVGKSGANWSYFTQKQPPGHSANWVSEVLDAQRSMDATVLLTPGIWADPATSDAAIDTMRTHAMWARAALLPGEHMAVNVTLSHSWLTTPHLRDKLLNHMMDMDENVFYVRLRWPLMPQPYGQLWESAILDGYMELSNVFEENDKVLILPNTGLTGWMSLAWGASGYSTGIGASERAFSDVRVIKIKQKGPRPEPTRRIYVPELLHITDTGTSEQLERLGAAKCRCRYCISQRKTQGVRWDKALAGAHYLRHLADITAEVATHGKGRRTSARGIVRDATAFAAASSQQVPLQKTNDPKHLAIWASRLR